jgi:O-phosphoseryl-tRNA synthetase
MKFDIEEINRESKQDYEKAWIGSRNLLEMKGLKYTLQKMGKSHPINDFIQDARKFMIDLGFEELILPMFIDEFEIYKEYGPEAALILDRVYYLAGIPRPDIGISKVKIENIKKIIPDFQQDKALQKIFRDYKKGDIESDNLIETLIEKLAISETQASEMIEKIFPEFKQLEPIPTKATLRSHSTALWFKVLSYLQKKRNLPQQYFMIGPKFRREQKMDATHLYCSNTLSCVIIAEEISLEDCKRIIGQICEKVGFKNNKTEIKEATSKYYAPQTEMEIFVEHPTTKKWLEIGDGGFYSPVSLAKFDIEYPVFNVGFGVERIVMIKEKIEDIRKLVYPYYYEDISFSDEEISKGIKYQYFPSTKVGIEIKEAIIKSAIENKDKKSPINIEAWQGSINNKEIQVFIWEKDEGVSLLGPAALNKIWVKDGSIIGLPGDKILENAIDTNKTYLEAIASYMAYMVEKLAYQNKQQFIHRVKICYRASEINLTVDELIMQYIHSKQNKVDIRGPIFVGLTYKVSKE